MRTRLKSRDVLLLAVLLALLATMATGCAKGQRPRLTQTTDAFATAMDSVADARDQGLITDAQVQKTRPIADAYWAAKHKADQQIAAGQTDAAQNSLEQAAAALAELQPLLNEIVAKQKAKGK